MGRANNGSTPYMALHGRTPNMLFSLSLSAVVADDSAGTLVGPARHVHRVREHSTFARRRQEKL
eukprot:6144204-Lingulodinium_polyedra.AAC.1